MYQSKFLRLLFGLLICSLQIYSDRAEAVCQVEIFVNDPSAKVSVDGIDVGASRVLPCKELAQRVRVEAPGKIPFVRSMPELGDDSAAGEQWQIELQVANQNQPVAIGGSPSSNVISNEASSDSAVMQELRRLRLIVESMQAERNLKSTVEVSSLPEMNIPSGNESSPLAMTAQVPVVETIVQKGEAEHLEPAATGFVQDKITADVVVIRDTPIREMPVDLIAAHSVMPGEGENRAPAASSTAEEHLSGFFVLLHALKEDRFNQQDALAELKGFSAQVAGKFFKFCRFAEARGKFGPEWVKVFLGPFTTQQEATLISQGVGRGTFVVEKPECKTRPWPDVEVTE